MKCPTCQGRIAFVTDNGICYEECWTCKTRKRLTPRVGTTLQPKTIPGRLPDKESE